ncbi:Hpt domain-containing protein [Luteibacter yeojuensis]|uniref:Hpt domain-containing protein n=1 Tax=Luteibacter yeojuensis TaxID=345309 RepID=A0A7X5QSR8_9GAMM|nr:Hpt domain-containing protein [Luteibacter yeojuensis]NID14751.1 Hpt domain-containing protein [Luteibacter yeojuensis]
MSISRLLTPLRRWFRGWRAAHIADDVRPHARPGRDLPHMLSRVAARYAAKGRARRIAFEIEVDPGLARDVTGPFDELGGVLCALLDRAMSQGSPYAALHVDVVGDDVAGQLVHFTVVDGRGARERDCPRLRAAAADVAAIGGVIHTENTADAGDRVIVELAFDLPRRPPRIDVNALRGTLGGEAALGEVIVALDRALCSDLADLDALLEQPGVGPLQAWLHRISGALGMAEASELARIGLALERELAGGRRPHVDRAVRRFAEDATGVLALLREQVPALGYSPEP